METSSHINYLAFAVAVVVYFAIGALWFSVLFGKQWIALTGVQMTEDSKKKAGKMFGITFLINVLICAGIACLVWMLHSANAAEGLHLGLILGVCFMFAPCAMNYMYAQRPFKLVMIDAGYHVVAITTATVIMSVWK